MYILIHVLDYTCQFERGRNNPHSKSGRGRDDYMQPFSHSIPMLIEWDQVSSGRDQIKSSRRSGKMEF